MERKTRKIPDHITRPSNINYAKLVNLINKHCSKGENGCQKWADEWSPERVHRECLKDFEITIGSVKAAAKKICGFVRPFVRSY